MKLTIAFLFFAALQSQARGFSQNITLTEKNAPLIKVFRAIEKQTGLVFFFDEAQLAQAHPVTIAVTNVSVRQALEACLLNQPLTYTLVGENIVISTKSSLVFASKPPAPDIKGRVTDEQGNALSGASVQVKNSGNGTQTDAEGRFSLQAAAGAILVVSYVGYTSREVNLKGYSGLLVVALQPLRDTAADIVVIAYGAVRKKDLTGAVAQIKSEDLTSYPATNMIQSMQGRAAGVQVKQNNGAPGAAISVRIRGTNSILGGNEPLYVIDGFPYSGNPTFLQNADIASVEILKDASSTAIYGSRGANGVVIITTKSGKRSGKNSVEAEAGFTLQQVNKKMKLLTPGQYAQLYNEQAVNDGVAPYFTQQQVDSLYKTPDTDWQNLVMHRAPLWFTSVTVNGGNEKTRFSLSNGIFRQQGIIHNSDYNRYSLRFNINHDISKVFNIAYNATLTRITSNRKNADRGNRGSDIYSGMLVAPPTLSPYLADGTYRRLTTAYPFISNALANPVLLMNETSDYIKADRVFTNAALLIKPVRDLSIRISGGLENSNDRTDQYSTIQPINSSVGNANVITNQLTSFLNENVVNYNKTLKKHRIDATAGFTYQDYVSTSLSGSGSGFLSDVIGTGNLGAAATPGIPASGYSKWVLLSMLGRINYNYSDKYLLTVSFRRDGSSRYATNNQWSNFPSAAIAWHLSNENFFPRNSVLNDVKLRSSYGVSGSAAISPYQTLNQLSASYTTFGDAIYSALAPGTTLPGNLKWETTHQLDAGIDATLLNNRLHVTADFYVKKTKNLLNRVQLPASMGYTNTLQNVGEIQNKGIELGLDATVLQRAVNWTVSANISFNRNKVLKLYEGQDIYGQSIYTGSLNDFVNLLREGQPLGVFYGYEEKGYTATGNIEYVDRTGEGAISNADKTYIGNPNPDFIYGFNSVTTWKGLSLTVFIQGSQGNDIFNLNKASTLDMGMGLNQPQDLFYNHWASDKTNAAYPKISRNINGNMSNRFVEDGSYLRLKNIQLAYNLPLKKTNNNGFKSAQVYISGQNLITITGYSWYDPDINAYGGSNAVEQGIDYYTYPTSKSVTLGIRCGF
ncbi:TonB-dependent receptor [Filimonas lacunae]|nr:TonB-dependent receptor [Filimonas lacunae]